MRFKKGFDGEARCDGREETVVQRQGVSIPQSASMFTPGRVRLLCQITTMSALDRAMPEQKSLSFRKTRGDLNSKQVETMRNERG